MQNQDIAKKAKQFIDKNIDLLNDKKYYQFAQKVKLLANRKLQTKKINEAEALFKTGADALYSIQQVEKHAPFQLILQLVQLYEKQLTLLTEASQSDLLRILQKKPIESKQIKMIHKLLQKTGPPAQHPVLSNFYLKYGIKNKKFANVQRIAASLQLDKAWDLVQKWQQHVRKEQIPALWCRMVLWRGIFHSINDAQQTFQRVRQLYPQENPYFIFTSCLLKTILLNSKNAYQAIQRTYSSFLEVDPVFACLFSIYGQKYFKIEKNKGGLFSLMQ